MRTEAGKKVFVSMKWKELGEREEKVQKGKKKGLEKGKYALHDDVFQENSSCLCICVLCAFVFSGDVQMNTCSIQKMKYFPRRRIVTQIFMKCYMSKEVGRWR